MGLRLVGKSMPLLLPIEAEENIDNTVVDEEFTDVHLPRRTSRIDAAFITGFQAGFGNCL